MCKKRHLLKTITQTDGVLLILTNAHIQFENKWYYRQLSIYRENAFNASFPIGCSNPPTNTLTSIHLSNGAYKRYAKKSTHKSTREKRNHQPNGSMKPNVKQQT